MAGAMNINFIPTGSLPLDLALGTGGLPRGRISEISGAESSGKTTLCLHLIAEAQKLGVECAFIDIDGALDPSYARRCGVDTNKLYVAEPGYAEQALEITDSLAHCSAVALIVVDSISALVSRAELDIPLGETYRDPSQDLLSRTLRRLRGPIRQNDAALVFTTRTAWKRGPVYHKLASNPARLSLRLHCAVCLALRTQKLIQEAGEVVGQRVLVEVVKNRFSPYRQQAELDIIY
jgi:recombination protein RecA